MPSLRRAHLAAGPAPAACRMSRLLQAHRYRCIRLLKLRRAHRTCPGPQARPTSFQAGRAAQACLRSCDSVPCKAADLRHSAVGDVEGVRNAGAVLLLLDSRPPGEHRLLQRGPRDSTLHGPCTRGNGVLGRAVLDEHHRHRFLGRGRPGSLRVLRRDSRRAMIGAVPKFQRSSKGQ